MSKNELRGATRRAFMQGAVAVGAALGWGPGRLLDFLDRGAGLAHADGSTPMQRLVIFCGQRGAHGYPQLIFPHPDSYADSVFKASVMATQGDRFQPAMAAPFLQPTASGGDGTVLAASVSNVYNYNAAPPAVTKDVGFGTWAAGERFRYYYGVGNQAFSGFLSPNATSRAIDMKVFGLTGNTPTPSNVGTPAAKKFIIQTRHTPWLSTWGLNKAVTVLDGAGITPFHIEGAHNQFVNKNKGYTVMAAAATLQTVIPTITPVIIVGNLQGENGGDATTFYGVNTVPGSPAPATVANAASMVDLFNSNAARAGGILSNPANATLFNAYTKGLIGSSKTATVPNFTAGYNTAKAAANLVGLNLSSQLLPTPEDQARYGVVGDIPKAGELRDRMIVTAKALKLGLTAQVVMGYFDDDPHTLFTQTGAGGINASAAAAIFGNLLQAFMADLMSVPDPYYPGTKLGDNTVIAFVGDVPRTALNNVAWNDPTFGGQNRTWIMSNGALIPGFFGGDRLVPGDSTNTNNHTSPGPGEGGLWDLNTGDLISFSAFDPSGNFTSSSIGTSVRQAYGETAMAAVLYAVTRGDIRAVNNYYSGPAFPAVQPAVII